MLNPNWNMDDQINAAKQALRQYMPNVPPQHMPVVAGVVIAVIFGLLVWLGPRQAMTNSTPAQPTTIVRSLVPTAPAAQPTATAAPNPTALPVAAPVLNQTGRGLPNSAVPTSAPTDMPDAPAELVPDKPAEIVREVIVQTNDGAAIVTTDSNNNVTSTGAGACNIARGARRGNCTTMEQGQPLTPDQAPILPNP